MDTISESSQADGLEGGVLKRILGGSMWLLCAAAVALALGLVAFLGQGLVIHGLGYAMCSLVSFSLVALFRRRSLSRMFEAGIAVSRSVNLAALCILLMGFGAAITHSWLIARQIA